LNILVALEGVLSSDNSDNPSRVGAMVYYGFKPAHRVAIFTSWSKPQAEHWLNVNGFVGYDELIDNTYDLIGDELAQRQITVARSRQQVELLVTGDPKLAAWAFEQGLPSLVLAHPDTMLVQNRPDAPKKMRAWTDIEEVITKRNIKRSLDAANFNDGALFRFDD
jgi:hypothetical protein